MSTELSVILQQVVLSMLTSLLSRFFLLPLSRACRQNATTQLLALSLSTLMLTRALALMVFFPRLTLRLSTVPTIRVVDRLARFPQLLRVPRLFLPLKAAVHAAATKQSPSIYSFSPDFGDVFL